MATLKTIDPNAYTDADVLVDEEAYDPLAGETDENAAEALSTADALKALDAERAAAPDEEDVLPYLGNPDEDHYPEHKVDDRAAEVRIAELFDRMKTRRKVLLGVLQLCAEPADVDAINSRVDEMQASYRSVFDGPALTTLLERAGALEKVADEEQKEPQVVEVDGVEYLEPAKETVVRYRTTPEGMAVVEADKPMDRLHAAFDKEAVYKPIFLRILKACAEEGGKSAKELGELVDSDPLLQNPRYWAAHFFNILGECDALTWNKTWQITELGWKAVEELELEGVDA